MGSCIVTRVPVGMYITTLILVALSAERLTTIYGRGGYVSLSLLVHCFRDSGSGDVDGSWCTTYVPEICHLCQDCDKIYHLHLMH